MYLKTLTLQGFKSFAERTNIEFHRGVTGIVGPNGCGKSNVVDAVRWVLGETSAKALRGGEMADVIFNGTDKREPLGMAEVTLTMADCEESLGKALGEKFNEVAITRRVYRDGKSEYRLNNQTCRLKDILNILMDTGIGRTAYSIMEQGKIDQLLSSKPEDRRAVFEEAAGITKFKKDKKDALRKLEYTEANLLRNDDIMAELTKQKNSLQRQAAKARRYQGFLDHVRVLDTHFSHRQYGQFSAHHEELSRSIISLEKETHEVESKIAQDEDQLRDTRAEVQQMQQRIAERRQELRDTENNIASFTSRIGFNEQRVAEYEGLVAEHEGEIHGLEARLGEQRTELQAAETDLQKILDGIEGKRSQLEEQKGKHAEMREARTTAERRLREVRERIVALEQNHLSTKTRLETSRAAIQTDADRGAQLAGDLLRFEGDQGTTGAQLELLVQGIGERSSQIEEEQTALADAGDKLRSVETRRESLRGEVSELERTLSHVTTRLEVLREAVSAGEGFAAGTQAVLKGLDQPDFFGNGTRGVLASFLEVEEGFIEPIEAALGRHLQSILVSDRDLAVAIMESLEKSEEGEAALLPEEFLPSPELPLEKSLPAGALSWALEKVKPHDRVAGLVHQLLADVLVVPDLNKALELREMHPGLRFVTVGGNYVDAHGVVHGGREGDRGTSYLERGQELRRLETQSVEAETAHSQKLAEYEKTKTRAEEESNQVKRLAEKVQEHRLALSTEEGKRDLLDRELAQIVDKIGTLLWEQGEITKKNEAAEQLIRELEGKDESLAEERESLRSELSDLETQTNELAQRDSELTLRVQEMTTSLAVEERAERALKEQRDPLARGLQELTDLIGRRRTEIETHQERSTNAKAEAEDLAAKIEAAQADLTGKSEEIEKLTTSRAEIAGGLESAEAAIHQCRERLSSAGRQRGDEEVEKTRVELRMESLSSTIRERYSIGLDAFEPDPHALLLSIAEQKKAMGTASKRKAIRAAVQTEEAPEASSKAADGESITEENTEYKFAETDANNSQETTSAEGITADADAQTEAAIDEALGEDDGPDWEFVEEAVLMLRQRLETIGSVNLDAIDEFDEVEERLNFMTAQRDDLAEAKKQLLQIIVKIDKETKALFADTFEKVQKNFEETFRELFGKQGRASLQLVEPDDPLESGIEIIAKPPGKKLQSITLLSGGERSMTAVALLFSIYMVKPSPFCVLDELDAPLDESNIGRFLKVLDKFTDQSQFIIVTHNKRTMNRADIMYGITMEEFGVSKPVGMSFRNEKKATEPQLDDTANDDSESAKAAGSGFPEVFDKPE